MVFERGTKRPVVEQDKSFSGLNACVLCFKQCPDILVQLFGTTTPR